MSMQAHRDAPLFISKRADMQQPRQHASGSDRNRFDALEKPEIRRDAFASYNHAGTIRVAMAWLVLYGIAVAHPFLAVSLWLISLR